MALQINNILAQFGLNEKEISVYKSGLMLGQAPASLIGKKVNLARSSTKFLCDELVKKGLMTTCLQGNTTYYSAEAPNKFLYLINKEYENLEKKHENTKVAVAELSKLYGNGGKLPKVKYFTGQE